MCDFLDETEVFWKTLPDKAFGQKIKEYKAGKKCKQRFAITFIINGAGKSEGKSIVIWRLEHPRCLKGINQSDLPVEYFSQPKAWMLGEILHKVLLFKINIQLKSKGQSVILF